MRRPSLMAQASGVVLAVACSSAQAQIFKCPVGDGFSLQQTPCPGLGASGGRLVTYADGRRAPVPASLPPEEARTGKVLGRSRLPTPTAVERRK